MDVDDDRGPPGDADAPPPPKVTLVAAGELRDGQRWPPTRSHPGPSFKSVEWSADGTTIIASTSNKSILSYVMPADLLTLRQDSDDTSDNDASSSPRQPTPYHHTITPQGRLQFGIGPSSLAPAPYFSLAEPWSQSVLVGFRDRPIQLYPLFPGEPSPTDSDDSADPSRCPSPLASYPLVKPETEAYLAPMAMLWPAPGTHLVAGANSLLALFDLSRASNDPPLLRVPTTVARRGSGLGMRGTVSALAAGAGPSHSLTAAGTWTRGVGLYDLTRAGGECVASWNVAAAAAGSGYHADRADRRADIGGDGVVQTLWSPCGRYLVVGERKSRGLLVYDVRGSGELLCTLAGRPARAAQRVGCAVYASGGDDAKGGGGFELWSGTDHGEAVLYEGVGTRAGVVEPSWRWRAHESMVGGTAMHASGSVVATCAAARPVPEEESDSESDSESSSDDSDDESGSESGNDGESESSDGRSESDDGEEHSTEGSAETSSSSPGRASTRSRKRIPQGVVSDPSIKIWSLVA